MQHDIPGILHRLAMEVGNFIEKPGFLILEQHRIIVNGNPFSLTNVYLLKNADHTRKGPSKIPTGDSNRIPSTIMPIPNTTAAIRVESLLFRSFNTLNSFISNYPF